jgi:hypothetical protein
MIATIWPRSTAVAAGAVTCASTLPAHTAMPYRQTQAAALCSRLRGDTKSLAHHLTYAMLALTLEG